MANSKKRTKNKNNVTAAQDRRKTGPTPSRGNRRAVGAVTQRIEAARALTETITSIANRMPVPDSTPVAAGELHMTVASGANAALSLDREARLVTAALMYADRATLVSLGAHLLDGVASIDDWPAEHIVELLLRIGPYLRDPSFVRLLQAPRRQLVALVESPNGQVMLQGLRDVVAELTSTPGILALTQAREAGVLEVQRLVPRPQDEPYLEAVREHLSLRPTTDPLCSTPEILVSRLAGLLSGGRSLPVLDDGMGSMAASVSMRAYSFPRRLRIDEQRRAPRRLGSSSGSRRSTALRWTKSSTCVPTSHRRYRASVARWCGSRAKSLSMRWMTTSAPTSMSSGSARWRPRCRRFAREWRTAGSAPNSANSSYPNE